MDYFGARPQLRFVFFVLKLPWDAESQMRLRFVVDGDVEDVSFSLLLLSRHGKYSDNDRGKILIVEKSRGVV